MQVFKHRNNKKLVIIVENEVERSRLCSYAFDIGLQATSEKNKYYASIKHIPENEIEKFKKELA